jgi:hypothetical protein
MAGTIGVPTRVAWQDRHVVSNLHFTTPQSQLSCYYTLTHTLIRPWLRSVSDRHTSRRAIEAHQLSVFVTGNANKLKEVKAILAAGDSGIEVTSKAVDGKSAIIRLKLTNSARSTRHDARSGYREMPSCSRCSRHSMCH